MLAFRPPSRLGQAQSAKSTLTSAITGDLAKQIVAAADAPTRRIIKDERNRFAEALIGGIPFAGISALAFIGTRYFVPDESKIAKAIGYSTAALAVTIGAWWTFNHITEVSEPPPAPSGGVVSSVAIETAVAIVNEAEPKIRQIVEDEKALAVQAAMAGLPFAVGSLGVFLATMFMVAPENKALKAIGYSGTALLLGAGAYVALDKERQAMTT